MRITTITAVLALLWLAVPTAPARLIVHYVRHGQGGHNVQIEYDQLAIPRAERPSWVGDQGQFTPLGRHQVQVLATDLQPFTFDLIAVSPLWRTRQTILPYLKATGRTAEIWPELVETSFHSDPAAAAAGQAVFAGGKPIDLPADERPYFTLRPDGTGTNVLAPTTPAMGGALIVRVEELLRARFGTNDARVLLVGHGTAGLGLVRHLTRNPAAATRHMDNTRLWRVDEQPDGTYKLIYHNERAAAVAPAR
jgi:broad specificity phosphatase PhoE